MFVEETKKEKLQRKSIMKELPLNVYLIDH